MIRDRLEALHYWVFERVIDAAGWAPQHRERIYIVCFDRHAFPSGQTSNFPSPPARGRGWPTFSSPPPIRSTRYPTISGAIFRPTPRSIARRATALASG